MWRLSSQQWCGSHSCPGPTLSPLLIKPQFLAGWQSDLLSVLRCLDSFVVWVADGKVTKMIKPRTCKCMWQVLPSRKACCIGSPGHVPFAFVLLTLYSRICLVERFVSCNHEDKNHQLRIAECFIPDSLHRTKIKLYLVKCLIRFQLHAAKCNPDWYKKKFWVKWYMLLKVFIVCLKCPPKCCYAPWHSTQDFWTHLAKASFCSWAIPQYY